MGKVHLGQVKMSVYRYWKFEEPKQSILPLCTFGLDCVHEDMYQPGQFGLSGKNVIL